MRVLASAEPLNHRHNYFSKIFRFSSYSCKERVLTPIEHLNHRQIDFRFSSHSCRPWNFFDSAPSLLISLKYLSVNEAPPRTLPRMDNNKDHNFKPFHNECAFWMREHFSPNLLIIVSVCVCNYVIVEWYITML